MASCKRMPKGLIFSIMVTLVPNMLRRGMLRLLRWKIRQTINMILMLLKWLSFGVVVAWLAVGCLILPLMYYGMIMTLANSMERSSDLGRLAISDIICDKPVPLELQQDPDLWSGCISGAWLESEFCAAFEQLGFSKVALVDRQEEPWQVHAGIEFRSATLTAELPCC